jgi:hypothetical protein
MMLAGVFLVSADHPAHLAAWLAVGLAAILGHVFPIYLRFKGGKGVATSFGVALGLGRTSPLCPDRAAGLAGGRVPLALRVPRLRTPPNAPARIGRPPPSASPVAALLIPCSSFFAIAEHLPPPHRPRIQNHRNSQPRDTTSGHDLKIHLDARGTCVYTGTRSRSKAESSKREKHAQGTDGRGLSHENQGKKEGVLR